MPLHGPRESRHCQTYRQTMTDAENAEKEKIVTQAIDLLREHFDCVQIFVSLYSPDSNGDTVSYSQGSGHFGARAYQVRAWVLRQDERERRMVEDDDDPRGDG